MNSSLPSVLAWTARLVAPLLLVGCSHVGSSSAGLNTVSGEAWYVRTTTFLGLPVSNSVWYCAPPSEEDGHPLCREAKIHGVDGKKFTPIRRAIERSEATSSPDDSKGLGSSKSTPSDEQDDDEEETTDATSSAEADSDDGDGADVEEAGAGSDDKNEDD